MATVSYYMCMSKRHLVYRCFLCGFVTI